VALAAVLIIGATFGTWLWSHAPTKSIAGPAQYEQITYFAASATSPSLSPDGRMMTFIQGTQWFEGLGQVYVKALPDGEPVQLTHDRLEKMSPTFSPDGSRIVYTVARPPGLWDAWTVPVIGGEPRLWLKNTATPSWLPDKRIMFSEITSGLHMRVVTSTRAATTSDPCTRRVMSKAWRTGRTSHPTARTSSSWKWRSPSGGHAESSRSMDRQRDNEWGLTRNASPRHGPEMANGSSPRRSRTARSTFGGSDSPTARQSRSPAARPKRRASRSRPMALRLLASVGSSQQSVWLHDDRGERPLSTEGYAFIPRLPAALVQPFSADGNTLFYLARRGGVRSVGPFERSGELWRTDLESGRSEVVVPGFDIVAYDVSREMTQVVFAAIDKGGQSHIWLARLDRQLPPRQLSSIVSDGPRFGTSDEIFSRVTEGVRRSVSSTARNSMAASRRKWLRRRCCSS
jgi:hypothetical protein